MNLTKTIRKLPINQEGQRAGYYVHDDLSSVDIKYDDPSVRASSTPGLLLLLSIVRMRRWLDVAPAASPCPRPPGWLLLLSNAPATLAWRAISRSFCSALSLHGI
jgi:hypothetical protein